jgi:hypothetical protein
MVIPNHLDSNPTGVLGLASQQVAGHVQCHLSWEAAKTQSADRILMYIII